VLPCPSRPSLSLHYIRLLPFSAQFLRKSSPSPYRRVVHMTKKGRDRWSMKTEGAWVKPLQEDEATWRINSVIHARRSNGRLENEVVDENWMS
jgi:hypothetical protein